MPLIPGIERSATSRLQVGTRCMEFWWILLLVVSPFNNHRFCFEQGSQQSLTHVSKTMSLWSVECNRLQQQLRLMVARSVGSGQILKVFTDRKLHDDVGADNNNDDDDNDIPLISVILEAYSVYFSYRHLLPSTGTKSGRSHSGGASCPLHRFAAAAPPNDPPFTTPGRRLP